jgi:hypothetical protein
LKLLVINGETQTKEKSVYQEAKPHAGYIKKEVFEDTQDPKSTKRREKLIHVFVLTGRVWGLEVWKEIRALTQVI